MKVIYGLGKFKGNFGRPIVAIGVFDGLHLGHQRLIQHAVKKAQESQEKAIVMTFEPHPLQVLHPDVYLPMIASLSFRLKFIEALGVDVCIVLRFTKRFSQLSPQQFIYTYLVQTMHIKEVFVGDDFRFGKDRSGTLDYFKEMAIKYGFRVRVVRPAKIGYRKISSTFIRQLIAGGKLKGAGQLLGRRVSVMGKVVRGDARGKILGYPTANIYPQNEVIPPLGVYAVYVIIGTERFSAMANIGLRPSFKSLSDNVNIEVHIFDFTGDLYGKVIIVEFVKKIREEKAFQSKERLIEQLKKDEKRIRDFLESS